MPIEIQQLNYYIKQKKILHNISLHLPENTFTAILGQNGAGKSTLLRCIAGELQPQKGQIYLDKQPIAQYTPTELALKRAVLSQQNHIAFPIQVKDLIALGRINIAETAQSKSNVIAQILQLTQTESLADQYYDHLSGGEKQRAHLARILTQLWHEDSQQNKYLLLDEPTAALDVKFQYQLLETVTQFAQKQHITIIAVLHDINLAIQYAQNIVFLQQGSVVAQGNTNEIIQQEILEQVFNTKVTLGQHPTKKSRYVFWQ